jgi:simple sugar transport system ATP-binding protein
LVGAGQRELVLTLFGVLKPQGGEIFIEGRKVQLRDVQDALRVGMGYLPEDRVNEGIFVGQSVANNVVVTVITRLSRLGIIKSSKVHNLGEKYIRELNIKAPSARSPVETLSGGNQQRVVIAKWIAYGPKILILNGPTVGIDVASKAEIHRLIRRLASENKLGIILISDDIPEVLSVCDRVLLMKKGRVVAEYEHGEISEEALYLKMIEEVSGV